MKRLLLLAFLIGAAPLPAQHRRLGGPAEPPLLEIGQRVRVWTWEPVPAGLLGPAALIDIPALRTRKIAIAGSVAGYDPLDSLQLRRQGAIAALTGPDEITFQWADITRIDAANGRNVLGGALSGLGLAFGVALLAGLVERAFGCQHGMPESCGSVWKRTARVSVVAVPVGAVVGVFFTRWKRVY